MKKNKYKNSSEVKVYHIDDKLDKLHGQNIKREK